MVSKNNISRRKFLTVSAAATAALICAGCGIKVEPSTKTGSADPTFPLTDQNAATRLVPTISTAAPSTVPTTTPIPAPTQTPVVATSRCPKGLVNDPYPGRCRRYIDTNGNGYCDLSEVG